MDWLTKMNAAIDYIETNLTGEIDFSVIAQKACCSTYNFQRMFSFVTDVTLAEYIRRRRLTLAALELQNTDIKVIDLALKYGYDSATSFSRAFQSLHGITPTSARAEGVTLKAYPCISFRISIKGDMAMNYRIESKKAFQIFGVEGVFKTDESGEYPKKPSELWTECHKNGEFERLEKNAGDLPDFVNGDLCKVHGACDYRHTEEGSFPYMLCAFKSGNSVTDGFTATQIPAHTWAIFPSEKFKWENFDGIIDSLYKKFYSEWLPISDYEQIGALNLELYGGSGDLGYVELWFAVKKK